MFSLECLERISDRWFLFNKVCPSCDQNIGKFLDKFVFKWKGQQILLVFARKKIPKLSHHKIGEETLVLTQSGKKKKILYFAIHWWKNSSQKKHGAVNKLLQGCHVRVPLGFLSLVNFHQISTTEKWFQPVQRIFHEKKDPKLPNFEGKKNSKLPNIYDKLQ